MLIIRNNIKYLADLIGCKCYHLLNSIIRILSLGDPSFYFKSQTKFKLTFMVNIIFNAAYTDSMHAYI